MSLFSLDPGLAIWTWISFLVLLAVLYRFAFPSILQSLKDRENLIAKSVDDAQAIEQQLAASQQEHEKVMQQAKNEADAVVRKAREEAEALRRRLTEKAEKEADEILRLARQRIAEDREAALAALTDDLAEFVCEASEQVVGKSFAGETERTWARELAEQI